MQMKKTGYVFVFLFNYFHITKTSFHDRNKLARQQKSQIICLTVISVVKYHLKGLQHRNLWVQKRRITNLIYPSFSHARNDPHWPTPGIPNTGWSVNKGLVFIHTGGSATRTHCVWRYNWQVCVMDTRAFTNKSDVSKNKNNIGKNAQ